MSLPTHHTVVAAESRGKLIIRPNAPVPALDADMVLVKTAAVAINPHDAKTLEYSVVPGAIVGGDFAGTVVALGADALAAGRLSVGDRVAGTVLGMNKLRPDVGAFAEYVNAMADFLLKIPDDMSFEDAATLPLGVGTALYALFSELGIPASLDQLGTEKSINISNDDREFVLVAGGSTATGTRAIQLLKLAGLRPIATCSPSNFDLALRFGAEKVFDYHQDSCAADIRAYTGNELAYALDCVAQADTTQLCYAALGRAGGRYVTLEPFREAVAQTRPLTVQPSWFMAPTLIGVEVDMHGEFGRKARPEDRLFGARAFLAMQGLLDRGLVDTHPAKVMPGAWEGIMHGVDTMRTDPPSGFKLVYPVS
ncbi:chaperonin 10-like protein [Xylariales sp. PMI_506]|nr:chaperonin 10-like protein [Xylariales sp. PMI_506]